MTRLHFTHEYNGVMSNLIKRTIVKTIKEDLKGKMVFLGGPRQVGKTTLAQSLISTLGFEI